MSQSAIIKPAYLKDEEPEEVDESEKELDEQIASQLPEPKGYKVLITMPVVEEATAGGILKAAQTKHIEEVGSVCGFVLKIGPDAYQDTKRFPNGPYCKEGDWVMFRSYSGTRFTIYGREMRLMNDDTIEAVVSDPRGIAKK